MLMGHSVEGRFPYLDYRVAEFAARLPSRLKLLGLHEKVGLRRAVADLVPAEIRSRKKWPYRAPIGTPLLMSDASDGLLDLLEPRSVEAAGLFDSKAVTALLSKLRRQNAKRTSETDEMALVGALSTMLLHERFVVRRSPARPATPRKIVERSAGTAEAPRHVFEVA
jgi:asparagine synthase (glutamine-hydrolysing)